MRYYFEFSSKSKCGCKTTTKMRYTDTCKSKAEVKRKFGCGNSKIEIYSEKQVNEQFVKNYRDEVLRTAICWD